MSGSCSVTATAAASSPRWTAAASHAVDRVAGVLLSVCALIWAMAALWPRGDLPAWPAVSLGLLGLALSWTRGRVWARAMGSIVAVVATLLGCAQIAVLWAAAEAMSYM